MKFDYDVAIVGGLGHIVLPLGIVFADEQNNVLLINNNLSNSEKVLRGEMPFIEYGADDLLKKALSKNLSKIISYTSEVKKAKPIIFCIGTPIDE